MSSSESISCTPSVEELSVFSDGTLMLRLFIILYMILSYQRFKISSIKYRNIYIYIYIFQEYKLPVG